MWKKGESLLEMSQTLSLRSDGEDDVRGTNTKLLHTTKTTLWLRSWTGSFVSNCSCVRSVHRNKMWHRLFGPFICIPAPSHTPPPPPPPPHIKSYSEIIKSRNVAMATRQAWFMRTALKRTISVASHSCFPPVILLQTVPRGSMRVNLEDEADQSRQQVKQGGWERINTRLMVYFTQGRLTGD